MDKVFYFTATGNSLYAAKKFSAEPISIPQVMRGADKNPDARYRNPHIALEEIIQSNG